MEVKHIKFVDNKSLEDIQTLASKEDILKFLQYYRLEFDEIIELNDSVYSIKEISIRLFENGIEILVYSEFMDLIENIPTA